ncbi:unnamed protein product [Rhizoctonia solani]|uniref:ADP-ribosylation factor n=1 Tax=Rhizoctonia solani TaxID=456999 RepID=A0A8H3CWE8_9AGAM|nr:unnamed protein product [Rhizoctonia solani]
MMLPEFLTRLFPGKQDTKRILMLGLDGAGKTTFLYRMCLGEVVTTIPTIGFNVETVKAPTSGRRGSLQLTCWDVGGCDKIRPLLKHYTVGTDAVIWVLDSNDRERLQEAIDELRVMLVMTDNERGKGANPVPCLILANKQDLKATMTLDEVRIKMAPVISIRPSCAVFATSLISDNFSSTITPAMNWLYDVLNEDQSKQRHSQNLEPHTRDIEGLAEKLNSWVERASMDVSPSQLLEAFEGVNLPSWDHYTHIRIAYTILRTHGRQKGLTWVGIHRWDLFQSTTMSESLVSIADDNDKGYVFCELCRESLQELSLEDRQTHYEAHFNKGDGLQVNEIDAQLAASIATQGSSPSRGVVAPGTHSSRQQVIVQQKPRYNVFWHPVCGLPVPRIATPGIIPIIGWALARPGSRGGALCSPLVTHYGTELWDLGW